MLDVRCSSFWSLIRHTPLRRVLYVLDVLVERSPGRFVARLLPRGATPGQFRFVHFQIDPAVIRIDGDPVAGLRERDRTALDGFGDDMADDEAMTSAAESP